MKSYLSTLLILIFSFSIFGQETTPAARSSAANTGNKKTSKSENMPIISKGGKVEVQVTIDEKGNVISARALSGPKKLRKPSAEAALKSKFVPTVLRGEAVKVTGIIIYNFVTSIGWEDLGGNFASLADGIISTTVPFSIDAAIWKDFKPEKEEYMSLLTTKSSEDRIQRARMLAAVLREKLAASQPGNFWLFNLGFTISKLKNELEETEDAADFQVYLKELARLVESAPGDMSALRLEILKRAVKFSNEANLDKDKKKEIIKMIVESSNETKGK